VKEVALNNQSHGTHQHWFGNILYI